MATEEYSIGYQDGYQDGWNKALAEQPARVPLTDEEIAVIASTPCAVVGSYVHTFARAIERAHGIGGGK